MSFLFGSSQPPAQPPPPPPPPPPPTPAIAANPASAPLQATAMAQMRAAQAAGGPKGFSGTLLTSPMGAPEPAKAKSTLGGT